jgi:hypothetical protein
MAPISHAPRQTQAHVKSIYSDPKSSTTRPGNRRPAARPQCSFPFSVAAAQFQLEFPSQAVKFAAQPQAACRQIVEHRDGAAIRSSPCGGSFPPLGRRHETRDCGVPPESRATRHKMKQTRPGALAGMSHACTARWSMQVYHPSPPCT